MLKSGFKLLVLSLSIALLMVGVARAQDKPSGEIKFVFWENTPAMRSGWEGHVARFNE